MWHTFSVLLVRDLTIAKRSLPSSAVRIAVQPVMFVFVFSYVMPSIAPNGRGYTFMATTGATASFSTALIAGIAAMTITFQGVMSVTLPLMNELAVEGEMEDRLLAPIPVWAMGLAKILSGGIHALLGAFIVFPVVLVIHAPGNAPEVEVRSWLLLTGVLIVSAYTMAAFGLLLGTLMNPKNVNAMFSTVMVPVTFLGCVYYPWSELEVIPWLQVVVLTNPVVYVSESLRVALTPTLPHMPAVVCLPVLAGTAALMTVFALRMFRRRVIG
jgi:ABC-2 type transport system permease protein